MMEFAITDSRQHTGTEFNYDFRIDLDLVLEVSSLIDPSVVEYVTDVYNAFLNSLHMSLKEKLLNERAEEE